MRPLFVLLLALAASPVLAEEADLPKDVAARHSKGAWRIRMADLHRYLVRYYAAQPTAVGVLPEYLKLRLVEDEARKRKVTVSDGEVEKWLETLDANLRGQIKEMRKHYGMQLRELSRRGRQWLLQKKVAREIINEKDTTRKKDAPISDDTIILVIDELYRNAEKKNEGLPKGVVARIRDIDVTDYEYGRALRFSLAKTEVLRALRGLILVEEVALVVGDRDPPSKEEMAAQEKWYLTYEKNRIRRMPDAPKTITTDMIKQVLKQRGLSLEMVSGNPSFQAQARAIGHFRATMTDAALEEYFEQNRAHYGTELQVARILVGARAQNVPGVGRKIRTLHQGKAAAGELWHRLKSGQRFAEIARNHSEDADAIRLNGGTVPFWITADRPDYAETFREAAKLEPGEFSKPFFSQGRGYVIVKLLGRKKAKGFKTQKSRIRRDAGERAYHIWRNRVTRAALVNRRLTEQEG